jgi:Putative motility protein
MDNSISSSLINNAASAQLGTVQGSAQLMVLKKAQDLQGQGVMELLSAAAAPPLATSGPLGTRLNVYA